MQSQSITLQNQSRETDRSNEANCLGLASSITIRNR